MFLLLLAALTAIKAVDEVVSRLLKDRVDDLQSYIIATVVVIAAYGVYLIISGVKHRKYERSSKSNHEENE